LTVNETVLLDFVVLCSENACDHKDWTKLES